MRPMRVDELELKDLPLKGGCFTWKGGQNNQRMARLDKFLVTDDWDGSFGDPVQTLLPRPTSDHFPVLLEGGGTLSRGPMLFRFENMWLKADNFMSLIMDWWQNFEATGLSSFILVE